MQKLVAGNPGLVICAVTQGRSGVEAEIENNQRYVDITPILIVAGIMFLLVRLMMVGKGNPEAYIFAGCFGTLLFSVSYVMQAVPHE